MAQNSKKSTGENHRICTTVCCAVPVDPRRQSTRSSGFACLGYRDPTRPTQPSAQIRLDLPPQRRLVLQPYFFYFFLFLLCQFRFGDKDEWRRAEMVLRMNGRNGRNSFGDEWWFWG
ncbi:hypothetical protein Fot_02899 [Forsythia ovata]|uniref:Uncharacterized protein n=1 Tax=Forsythia ovata TaxID=205694 RepID=A0ABD1X914_9LAMI